MQNILIAQAWDATKCLLKYVPKIADFGLARWRTKREMPVAGTRGHMAPEAAGLGQFSEKSDAYSFGQVMLRTFCPGRGSDYSDMEGKVEGRT
eukprot:6195643-Amphidinium_carterae.1